VPAFRTGTVTDVLEERDGLQRVDTTEGRAYALTHLTGPVAVGDDVVLNTTGVDLGLGTGGWHVVHWNLSRREWARAGPGHIMKLRYTSLQADTGAAEEQHADIADRIDGMPVIACTVHSQVGVVATVLRHLRPSARIAYVMTDGACLPIAMSDLVHAMRERGVLDVTLTAGHALGGDLEAVTVASALCLARHVARADVAVVGMGPGVVGTGTALGTTALEAAAVLDTAAALGGRPILCVRASDGDQRPRHQGTSHHATTVLRLTRVEVEAPDATTARHLDVAAILDGAGISVTTMGRAPSEDPLFFATAAAAAVAAASRLPS
jgi:hypothetical protein